MSPFRAYPWLVVPSNLRRGLEVLLRKVLEHRFNMGQFFVKMDDISLGLPSILCCGLAGLLSKNKTRNDEAWKCCLYFT